MDVENRMRTSCLGVVIEETAQKTVTSEEASALLAETIIAKQLVLPFADKSVGDFIGKAPMAGETISGRKTSGIYR